jgi:ABC-type multidrug transport system ATPase subunit
MSGVCGQYPKGLIGYCPQQTTLFTDLTVQQQVEYFAGIKGVRDILEVEALIIGLNLGRDRDVITSKLSLGS